ncbi:flagellar hook-basal body complex protein FliE [Actinoplanes sp. NEAU-A12]|uniref:Flagellar hook-basal body complex protein FliE n=1 Tax=Actinoplanes sandaracinus TaxID=3045177 RepID=A0ABT6WJL8_9ACTN|nr:flagellar hook-basal body complex protein FliE [Actinoplanes sandaracinus]MDI6099923.1 flagellar hook-basal body complex protein FliE [Actinoplanes sandaracinus]
MTSPISPLGGFSAVEGISGRGGGLGGVSGLGGLTGSDESAPAQGPNTDFAGMLAKGIENVHASQAKASDLAVQVADGRLVDPAQYTIAATEASLGLQLTMAVRNKAVEAFQEIMRMQA